MKNSIDVSHKITFVTGKFSLHMENSIDVHCKNIKGTMDY